MKPCNWHLRDVSSFLTGRGIKEGITDGLCKQTGESVVCVLLTLLHRSKVNFIHFPFSCSPFFLLLSSFPSSFLLLLPLSHSSLSPSSCLLLLSPHLKDIEGAMTPSEISTALGLSALKNRTWAIFKTSAIKGEGLEEAMEWYENSDLALEPAVLNGKIKGLVMYAGSNIIVQNLIIAECSEVE